jgi:hypothetical protein
LKVDRYAKDLFKRLDDLSNGIGHSNSGIITDDEYDDGYYIEIGSEPPSFADYRAARAKINDAFGNKTFEDVWDHPRRVRLLFENESEVFSRRKISRQEESMVFP